VNGALIQIAALIASLIVLKYAFGGDNPYGRAEFIYIWTPLAVWIAPYFAYVVELRTKARATWLGIASFALVGNLALVIAYMWSGRLLRASESAAWDEIHARCLANPPASGACVNYRPIIDPPPPPLHWETAVFAYGIVLLILFVVLNRALHRTRMVNSANG